MIKQRLTKLALYASTAAATWASVLPLAHAEISQTGIAGIFGFDFTTFMAAVAAWISNTLLSLMGIWVTMTGALLNVSITLTLQIKDFVESTQGVYIVWQTIRDVSGMFIIFMLLYASFKMILSQDNLGTSVGSLIKNIVIMGIMINFSFFIVSLLIDASNIVSMTLYRGIVATTDQKTLTPEQKKQQAEIEASCRPDNGKEASPISTCVTATQMFRGTEGGISDVFMSYLKPQSIYSYNGSSDPNAPKDMKPLAILVQGIVGSIIMFTMGLSFILAALAFVIRFLILVLLLAFSPIWFASYAIPQLKAKADTFTGHLKDQLIFMPVYMLLLYASLRILESSTVFTHPSGDVFGGTGGTLFSNMIKGYSILAINDFFIIFLLNMPLVTALSMSGMAGKWMNDKKWGAEGIWKGLGKTVGGYVGTRTAGKWSGQLDKALGNTKLGNSLLARDIRSATIGAVAKNKMGASRNYEELTKVQGDIAKKNKEIDRNAEIKELIASAVNGTPYAENPTTHKPVISETFGKMNEKEKLSLVGKSIKDDAKLKEIVKHLKSDDFTAIKKSEDFSDEDKAKIISMRKDALDNALNRGHALGTPAHAMNKNVIKSMVDGMDGKELLKLGDTMLVDPDVVEHLKPSQLKAMSDEGISDGTKRTIGNMIDTWPGSHRAKGFVNKNAVEWL